MTKMIDTIRSVMSRKVAVAIGAAAIILTVATAAFVIGRITAQAEKTSSADNPPYGGLDLAGYCRGNGYETNTEELCLSRTNLDKACDWTFNRDGLRLMFVTLGNLYSGVCHDPETREEFGGIDGMTKFCQSQVVEKSVADTVDAEGGEAWFCLEPINKNVACIAQYREEDAKARLDAQGQWYCYPE